MRNLFICRFYKWLYKIYFLMRGKIKKNLEKKNSFSLLYELFLVLNKKRKKQLFISFFVIILASISEIFTIYLILPFLSLLLNDDSNYKDNLLTNFFNNIGFDYSKSIYLLAFFLVFFIIASSSLRLFNLWININLTQKITGELSYDSYKKTLHKPYSFHINKNSSIIISSLNKSIEGTSTAIDAALQLIASVTIIFAILIGLSIINLKITIISLSIFSILYLIIFILTKNVLYKNSRFSVKNNSLRFRELSEGLAAIREIIIDGNQDYFIKNFSILDKKLRKKVVQNSFIIAGDGNVIEPDGPVLSIGSGGGFAQAAALAFHQSRKYSAKQVAEKSLKIAADLCIYTNDSITVLEI